MCIKNADFSKNPSPQFNSERTLKLMKKTIIFFAHFLFLITILVFAAESASAQNSYRRIKNTSAREVSLSFNINNINFEKSELDVFDSVNRARLSRGLNDLEWDDNLARLARSYSQKMADEDFFSHYERNGSTVVERARAVKIKKWRRIGENLFESIGDRNFSGSSVQMWMKSPTHRQNILDLNWTTSGIGIARSRDGKIYITQIFIEK